MIATEAGCETAEDIRAKGFVYFKTLPNCGARTLEELSAAAGGWPDAPKPHGRWITRQSAEVLIEELMRRGLDVLAHVKAATE